MRTMSIIRALPNHIFTQEIEVGLPYLINLAVENGVQRFDGTTPDCDVQF